MEKRDEQHAHQSGAPISPDDLDAQGVASGEPPAGNADNAPEDVVAALPSPFQVFMARLRNGLPNPTREAKAMEKSRGLILLGVTLIGGLFLFLGLFTTDSTETKKSKPSQPNLGRPLQQPSSADTAIRSPLPQLNVNTQPADDTGDLTEKDVLGTMRSQGKSISAQSPVASAPQAGNLGQINFDDPALAEAYSRQGRTPPTRPPEEIDWNQAIAEYQAQRPTARAPEGAPGSEVNANEELRQSSLVFVRAAANAAQITNTSVRSALDRNSPGLLAEGTALVARLQHAVSSVAKVPVVAVVEYNYERDGRLVVPAGTRAYGQLAEASPQGFVGIKFEALEFPDGRREEIAGSALGMDRGVLKGDVNGKNTGKKFLTRAATGLGTIAAYMVGGRGLGGSSGIDNTILLRERLASNIAMAGEQQLAMMAYQQKIVVTVAANTRFYLVLHQDAIDPRGTRDTSLPGNDSRESGIVVQRTAYPKEELTPEEVRDLRQLRNEMRQMNQMFMDSQSTRPEGQ